MPVLPAIKPLIQAANQAYQDIRKPKEESYLHQGLATAGYLLGIPDTSGVKKTALSQLAELKLEGDTETQNAKLLTELETLLKHQDGDHFKALYTILNNCGALVTHARIASPAAIYFELQPHLFTLQSQLGPKHSFFLELKTFFQGMETYAKELLAEDELQAPKKLLDEAEVQLEATRESLRVLRDQNEAYLFNAEQKADQQRRRFHKKRSSDLLVREALGVEKDHLLSRLAEKTRELTKERHSAQQTIHALEKDRQVEKDHLISQLAEKTRELAEERHSAQQTIHALERDQVTVLVEVDRFKDLHKKADQELTQARDEAKAMAEKIAAMEADIEHNCAAFIDAHLEPKQRQIQSMQKELVALRAQLAQAKSGAKDKGFGGSSHGLYSPAKAETVRTSTASEFHGGRKSRHLPSPAGKLDS